MVKGRTINLKNKPLSHFSFSPMYVWRQCCDRKQIFDVEFSLEIFIEPYPDFEKWLRKNVCLYKMYSFGFFVFVWAQG